MTNTREAVLGTCECEGLAHSRRAFLKTVGTVAGSTVLATAFGDVFRQVAFGAITDNANVLVVLSLRGGADGLSLVVPHGDPAYVGARPHIALSPSELIGNDWMFGLHPALAPLLPKWRDGSFGAVHAVGTPQPNRSHFAAMEAIEDADPGSSLRCGWVNRMIGVIGTDEPVEGAQIGTSTVPTSLFGPAPSLSLNRLSSLKLISSSDPIRQQYHRQSLHRVWDGAAGPLGQGARAALTTSLTLAPLTQDRPPHNGAVYPYGDVGTAMAETARLIRAQVGTRVVTVDAGGWDMHTSLGTSTSGAMRNKVNELATGLAAFFADLGPWADRVTVVTISEFGRRVTENGSQGLDHGYGNCMLLLGAGVIGGRVHTRWPGLGGKKLVDGDLAVTVDIRSVLAEVLKARFPEADLSAVFPSFTPEWVGAVRSTP